jgi:hypothetical protein
LSLNADHILGREEGGSERGEGRRKGKERGRGKEEHGDEKF